MKSVLVIGAGKFGMHISKVFSEFGSDVLIMDISEELINDISPYVSEAKIGNGTKREVLEAQGVDNFDICVVSLGELGESLEATYLLKSLGASYIIAKANHELHAELLKRSGADEIVYPEKQIAERIATKHTARKVSDYIEITSDYSVCEMEVPQAWIGKALKKIGAREKYHINILAYRQTDFFVEEVLPSHVFKEHEHIMVFGQKKNIIKMSERL